MFENGSQKKLDMALSKKVYHIFGIGGNSILGIYISFLATRFSVFTTYEPFSGKVFSIDVSTIESVKIRDGNTGDKVKFPEKGQVHSIITSLNNFRYDFCIPKIPIKTGGWSYKIDIESEDTIASYYFNDSWITVNGFVFYGDKQYFQLFIAELADKRAVHSS
ncbi:hypothetical protein [Oscillibacter sp.]|uniref:hypothetical protein n=1 Tax=Oscillibacter sp. TaxID=1945593 RepID=UPI0028A9B71F|nr:hypothetical protein [Oscillibacter sp.]